MRIRLVLIHHRPTNSERVGNRDFGLGWSFISLLLLVITASKAVSAAALPNVGAGCRKNPFQPYADLIQKVAVMGNDDRSTYEAYARKWNIPLNEVNAMFAATGTLRCGGFSASAQVTEETAVLTTAGHLFFDVDKNGQNNCVPLKFRSCAFLIKSKGRVTTFEVDLDSVRLGECHVGSRTEDWAVVQLKRPVPDEIRPYKLPVKDPDLRNNPDLIHVSGDSDNFEVNGERPRYITHCKAMDFDVFQGLPMQTDCDAGGGASGSAQLKNIDGEMTMVAMYGGSTSKSDGNPYDSHKNFNFSVPMSGNFLNAARAASQEVRTRFRVEKKNPVTKASSSGI